MKYKYQLQFCEIWSSVCYDGYEIQFSECMKFIFSGVDLATRNTGGKGTTGIDDNATNTCVRQN